MTEQRLTAPIAATGVRIGSPTLGVIAEAVGEDDCAVARRLAACWNACDGVPTDRLEAIGIGALAHFLRKTTPPANGTVS